MKQHSLHSASTPLSKPKCMCESGSYNTGCSDPEAAGCIMLPIKVKTEPDLDPHFLSLELSSTECTVSSNDHEKKFDLLDLKSEIKSELSTDEQLSFEAAKMIVDPFEDSVNCMEPENPQVNNKDVPEHSESPGTFPEERLQHAAPQAKEDHNTETLVLTEPEELNQEGRVCHLLRYRIQGQKRLVEEQPREKETCKETETKRTKHKTSEAKRKCKKNSPCVCSLCGYTFSTPGSLQVHMRIHTGEKPYICPTCGKAFARSDWLKEHIRIHTGQKKTQKNPRLPCSQCDKTFAKAHGLRYHMRRHTRERPYVCHVCEKRFIDVSDLNQHSLCHSDVRAFVCTECGNSFHRRGTLQKHQRIHTGERPYSCPECGKALRYKYSLTMHMKTHRK